MDLKNTLDETVALIEKNDNFLLSSHVNPDGDGVGSILGMTGLLKKLGKKYSIICHDKPQEKLSFLKRFDEFVPFEDSMPERISFNAAIIIDSPHLDRIGDSAKLLRKDARVLNIDHHISGDNFGTVNMVVPEAAASAQIVVMVFNRMGIGIDEDSAESLYTGLCIDTGRFRFSNTTPEVFRVAAQLVDAGANPNFIANHLYYNTSLENTIGLSRVLQSIELHYGGKVASSYLDHEFLSSKVGSEVDTEGFINQPLSINGVEVAFLIREVEKGKTRVSIRSRGQVDVNALAQEFGGGGHARASGCRIEGSIPKVTERLLKAVESHFKP